MSVVAYHFWSPTCGPCQRIKPAVEMLKQNFAEVKWESINTHEDRKGLTAIHNIKIVPTIVVLVKDNNGKTLGGARLTGTDMMAYHRMIQGAVKTVSELP